MRGRGVYNFGEKIEKNSNPQNLDIMCITTKKYLKNILLGFEIEGTKYVILKKNWLKFSTWKIWKKNQQILRKKEIVKNDDENE